MDIPYVFVPYKQLCELYFGDTRSHVREVCGECISSSMYGFPVENRYLDNFGYTHGLFSSECFLEAIELFPPTALKIGEFTVNIVENMLIHDEHCFDEENEYLEKMGL